MSAITLQNIQRKFYPYIINRTDFKNKELQRRVTDAFNNFSANKVLVDPSKDYIYTLSGLTGYVVKAKRTGDLGQVFAQDTNLYRVRKAAKIQRLIDKYHLEGSVQVPQKSLYFHDNQWFVIAEKLTLSDDVPQINKNYWSPNLQKSKDLGPDYDAVIERAEKGIRDDARPITPAQARATTILAYEAGQTDLTLMNIFFTHQGKLAFIDTEPVKRYFIKHELQSLFGKIFVDRGLLKTTQSALGIAKFRVNVNDPEVRKVIDKTESYYLRITAIKTVAKLALLAIAFSYVSVISIVFVANVIKTYIVVKMATLILQNSDLIAVLIFARQKDGAGVGHLFQLEVQGKL